MLHHHHLCGQHFRAPAGRGAGHYANDGHVCIHQLFRGLCGLCHARLAYFEGVNDSFDHVPLTVPLIFRPDPAGTWLASFALPTSLFPTAGTAPKILPGSDLRFEQFTPSSPSAGRTVAALTFYTIQLATEADYVRACGALEAALPGLGLAPVAGAWRTAWVAYSEEAMVGDMAQECWVEVEQSEGGVA
jgi:hypothetical protein